MKNSGFSGRPTLLKSSYRLPKSYIPFMQDFMKIYKPDPLGMEGLLKPEQPLQLELGGLENTYISWEKIKEGDEDVARQDGVHRCVNLVSDILPKVVEDFSYNDITLLCSTQKTGIQIVNILEQKGIGCAHIFPDDPDDPDDYKIEDVRKMKFTLTKEKLKISTVHSFKGFESPLILYFLENKTPFEEAYTALTRLRLSQKNNSHIKVVCVDPKYDRYGETWGPTKGSEWLELK